MKRWLATALAAIAIAGFCGNVRALDLALPTDNDAIFRGGEFQSQLDVARHDGDPDLPDLLRGA